MRAQARVNKKIDKVKDKPLGQWEAALEEAERQILGHRRSITQLRGSVEIFKKKIASRESWPGQVQELGQKEARQWLTKSGR